MSAGERVALFSGGGARTTPNASKALVEFRAGKMNMSGTLVTPDKRKGMVMVEQGDDQLMHFKWKDRTTSTIEDDLIIFPDDVEFKKVTQCTTGRVFILKFKSTTRKLFFWMQEPKDDKDEEFCKKVNDFLNNPPAPGSSSSRGGSMGGGSGGLDLSNLGDSELQSLLNNMSQNQLVQLFGGAGGGLQALTNSPGSRQRSSGNAGSGAAAVAAAAAASGTPAAAATSTTTSATTTTSSSKPSDTATSAASSAAANIRLSDLQNVLSGLPTGAAGTSGPSVDLSSGLTTEVLQPLLENSEFVRKMKELLPEEEQAQDDATGQVRGTLHSPQFRQALGMFSSGLQTGQLAPLIREFNLGDAAIAAATKGDVEAFVKALQNNKKPTGDEDKKKDDDDDDGMALD